MKAMLEAHPSARLCGGDLNYGKIRGHAFFARFEWRDLYQREMPAPLSALGVSI